MSSTCPHSEMLLFELLQHEVCYQKKKKKVEVGPISWKIESFMSAVLYNK